MKILIELPTWLGDAVMASPAIENLLKLYPNANLTFIGSEVSVEIYKEHPNTIKVISLKKSYRENITYAYNSESYDFFITFRSSFRSLVLKFLIKANKKFQFKKGKYQCMHQVEKYNAFINDCFDTNFLPGKLKVNSKKVKKIFKNNKFKIGINPGAQYGNAKCWPIEEFFQLISSFTNQFDILIFGGKNEVKLGQDLEEMLIKSNITNYKNLINKTNISDLIKYIDSLDVFITGDSGPMHIAAALDKNMIALFGPTNFDETSPWNAPKSNTIKKTLNCQPCMKRECPLGHNDCMRLIKSSEVRELIREKFNFV